MKGWDKKLGTFGRLLSLLCAIVFLFFGGVYFVDVLQTGQFNLHSTDKLTLSFLFWGGVLAIVTVRGKLF